MAGVNPLDARTAQACPWRGRAVAADATRQVGDDCLEQTPEAPSSDCAGASQFRTGRTQSAEPKRLAWFARGSNSPFQPPCGWDRNAAMTGGPDTSTAAGGRTGRGIDGEPDCAAPRDALGIAAEAAQALAVDAALRHVGAAACDAAILPLDDLAGLADHPKMPDTIEEHPTRHRRMDEATALFFTGPATAGFDRAGKA